MYEIHIQVILFSGHKQITIGRKMRFHCNSAAIKFFVADLKMGIWLRIVHFHKTRAVDVKLLREHADFFP